MRYMATYDFMETMRNTNQWLGATATAFASSPAMALFPNPAMQWMAAWGEVTERSFQRMIIKPDWHIDSFTCEDGKDHLVNINTVVERPFGDLIHFEVSLEYSFKIVSNSSCVIFPSDIASSILFLILALFPTCTAGWFSVYLLLRVIFFPSFKKS